MSNFENMKVNELKDYARSYKLRGYSNLRKKELIDLILENVPEESDEEEETAFEPEPETVPAAAGTSTSGVVKLTKKSSNKGKIKHLHNHKKTSGTGTCPVNASVLGLY